MSDAPAKAAPVALAPSARISSSQTAETAAPKKAAPATEAPAKDIVLLGPPTADGAGVHVLRARNERIEAGELRAIQDGRPITGEIVTLERRKDNPRVCDVKDSYSPPGAAAAHKGPAKVATDAYRDGWDEVFGGNPSSSPLPPSRLN